MKNFKICEYGWICVVLAVWQCFRTFIEKWIICGIVDPIFSKFERTTFSTVVFLCLGVFVVGYSCKCYKKKVRIGTRLRGLSVLILVGWSFYRFVPEYAEKIEWYPLKWIPNVCYVDILALIGFCCIALGLRGCFRKEKEIKYAENGFVVDKPINEENEDKLDRVSNAKALAEKLMETDVETAAFTLGIVGNWGDGKSSFMALMKNYITNKCGKDVIMMEFNPWMYEKSTNLTHIFFNELRRIISPWDWRFSRELKRYSDALAQTGSAWSRFVSFLLIGKSSKDDRQQYDELCKRMRGLEKRIVVFIDDIDRLGRTEMKAVLQLVRNACNFPHMYFVGAYDKKYVINTLQGSSEYGRAYTEKIFQEEYYIPRITEKQIQNLLSSLFGGIFDDNNYYEEIMRKGGVKLSNYLLNYRDVRRFFNVLQFVYSRKKGEVEVIDLILYTLLNFRYPQINQLILDDIDYMLIKRENKRWLRGDGAVEAEGEEPHTELTRYIRNPKNQEKLGLKDNEIALVVKLVLSLWREKRWATPLSINYQDNIYKYSS